VVAVATTGARRHGNRPTYNIVAGNEGSVFTIEPHTGLSASVLYAHSFCAEYVSAKLCNNTKAAVAI